MTENNSIFCSRCGKIIRSGDKTKTVEHNDHYRIVCENCANKHYEEKL